MARNTKAQDPAAAALSAIEEALNLAPIPESERHAAPEPASAPLGPPAPPKPLPLTPRAPQSAPRANGSPKEEKEPRLPAIEENELLSRRAVSPPPKPAESVEREPAPRAPVVAPSPANDDRRSVGQILQALQIKTSRAPFVLAAVASLVWLAAEAFYVYSQRGSGALGGPQIALVALAGIGPVAFFFIAAALVRRAQEMRLTARSMAEIAMRLAEPEAIATEQVVTLSQAIRREVASMGDGIERALARASELDAIVRAEVSNLERSYTENERRIRSLIDGLSSEREAIVGNADRVRNTIGGAHATLSEDVEKASALLADTLGGAANQFNATVAERSEDVRRTLSRSGDELMSCIGAQSSEIFARLQSVGEDLLARLNGASEAVINGLADRVGEVDERLRATGEALISGLGERGSEVAASIDETGARVSESIISQATDFAVRLAETGDRIQETIESRGAALHEGLTETGERIAALIADSAQGAQSVYAETGETLIGGLEAHRNDVHQRLEAHVLDVNDRLNAAAQRSVEDLQRHGALVSDALASTTQSAADLVGEHAGRLESVLGDGVTNFDRALQGGHSALEETLATRLLAFEISNARHVDSLTQRNDAYANELNERFAAFEQTTQAHASAFAQQAGDLNDAFAGAATETLNAIGARASSC